MDKMCPGVQIQGIPLLIPIDVPEGGFLQVVVGENPMAIPTPSLQLDKGCMVAVIPPKVAEQLRPGLNQAGSQIKNPLRRVLPG